MKKLGFALIIIIIAVPFFIYSDYLKPDSFTVIVLPDTQKYTETHPDIFCEQTRWISENIDALNIAFVSHMGDIVDNGKAAMREWETASGCMGILDGLVPYGIIPGNHDTDVASKKSSGFSAYNSIFPPSRYASYEWYKGNFDGNQNNYQIVKAEGMDILFLNLEIEPSDEALAWAQKVVSEYPDTYTIVTTHKYLPDVGNARDNKLSFSTDGNTGEDIWKKLVQKNCSIKLVLNGHYHAREGENMIASANNCGNIVYQIVQDYQARENGGNGRLRIYSFMPANNIIEIKTFSPFTDTYETDKNSEFSIPLEI